MGDEIVYVARFSDWVTFGSWALSFELEVLVERMKFTCGQISKLEVEIDRALLESVDRHPMSMPGDSPALAVLSISGVGRALRPGAAPSRAVQSSLEPICTV